MISTQRQYRNAMKKMIRRVQSGEEIDPVTLTIEEAEILAECIRNGYVNGTLEINGSDSRTLDGKIHPFVYNDHIPLKGVAFLNPSYDWKFIVPTIISILALIVSLFN